MAIRKQNIKDKVKPGINFILSCPIRFNVSSTDAFRDKMNDYCKRNKTNVADVSRKLLFSFFNVDNLNEMTKNKSIKKSILKIGDTIKDEMGLESSNEFSSWYRQAFDKLDE